MIPFTILITWVFNSARGSVLFATILPGTTNASDALLRAVPGVRRPARHRRGGGGSHRAHLPAAAVAMAVAATVVVLVHGLRDLRRRPRGVPEVQGRRPPTGGTSQPLEVEAATAKAGPDRADDGLGR
jgi:hypothetical protein